MVTARVTGLVMPLMVRSPTTVSLSLPADFTEVLLKVMFGNLAASKKSSLSRCSSKDCTCEFRPDSGIVTSTFESPTLVGS